MLSWILLATFSNTCPGFKIVNHTDTWTKRDHKTVLHAGKTCYTKYSGCMVKFIKKEKNVYNVICRSEDK